MHFSECSKIFRTESKTPDYFFVMGFGNSYYSIYNLWFYITEFKWHNKQYNKISYPAITIKSFNAITLQSC